MTTALHYRLQELKERANTLSEEEKDELVALRQQDRQEAIATAREGIPSRLLGYIALLVGFGVAGLIEFLVHS